MNQKQEFGDDLAVCHKSYDSGNINFSNYHVTLCWSRDQMFIWL